MLRPPARWLPPQSEPAGIAASLQAALRPNGERADKVPLPPALFRLLAVRGVTDVEEAKGLLRPSLDALVPGEAITDLARAADRLADAVQRGERILVHGDYDVDGICSTAIMTRTLRALGGDVVPFIPDRMTDGYDLSAAGVAEAQRVGARVVLTCDCGTTAIGPACALKAAGIDLIISDHHKPGAELPEAFAIVNPMRDAREGADRYLAAVGVAWKLAKVVVARFVETGDAPTRRRTPASLGGIPGLSSPDLHSLVDEQLDLVALATVADVAPLRGDNRILVWHGLKQMANTSNRGLRALIRASRLDEKRLTAGRLGFTLAPRLNALGRLDKAIRGVELLLAESDEVANTIARECEELNERRQAMDRSILEEARRRVEAMDLDATYGLVLHDEGWHPGVIGIVASRVVELTGRPTWLIAVNDGVGKGSGRAGNRFDLHGALTACGDLLVKFGGHRAAAGLTIEPGRIPEFAERFNAIACERLTADDLVPELRTDLEVGIEDANEHLERAVRYLEPFGVGNPGPVFVSRGVRVSMMRRVGTDGLKFALGTVHGPADAVGWGLAHRAESLRGVSQADLAYRLEMHEYKGTRTLQANLLDIRV